MARTTSATRWPTTALTRNFGFENALLSTCTSKVNIYTEYRHTQAHYIDRINTLLYCQRDCTIEPKATTWGYNNNNNTTWIFGYYATRSLVHLPGPWPFATSAVSLMDTRSWNLCHSILNKRLLRFIYISVLYSIRRLHIHVILILRIPDRYCWCTIL